MINKTSLIEFYLLPENLKSEVILYISYLKNKHSSESRQKRNRQFGISKGKYLISDDFKAPLDDFKNYM